MKYYITIERALTRGYEIEANSEEEAVKKAEELQETAMNTPEEIEGGGEFWDYAICDVCGRDVVTWSR